MSACIIRRKSDGLYRSRTKDSWAKNRHWVKDIKKARIFTNVGYAKNSLRNNGCVQRISNNALTYRCENCNASKWHFCTKHAPMFPLIEKWLKKAIDNNFQWAYDVIPVEINIGE